MAATPFCKALIWASTPARAAGRPGLPNSMWMNFLPLAASRSKANLLISRMPALPMLGRPLSAKSFFAKSWGTILCCIISVLVCFARFNWNGKDRKLFETGKNKMNKSLPLVTVVFLFLRLQTSPQTIALQI